MHVLEQRLGKNIREKPLRILNPNVEEIVRGVWSVRRDAVRSKVAEIVDIIQSSEIGTRELIAILALRHGYSALFGYYSALRVMRRAGALTPSSFAFLDPIVRQELLPRIEMSLAESARAMSTTELVGAIYGSQSHREWPRAMRCIGEACNILDCAGRITKLPCDSRSGHGVAMWIHADHRYTPASIPTWNLKYVLLEVLSKLSAASAVQLLQCDAIQALIAVKERALSGTTVFSGGLRESLDHLRQYGLIEVKLEKAGRKTTKFYCATELAKLLLNTSYLSEPLRMLLLGVPYDGLLPRERDLIAKMCEWAKIARELEEGRCRKSRGYAASVMQGCVPWKNVSEEKLLTEYLPEVKRIAPEDGEWLERKIKSGLLNEFIASLRQNRQQRE